MIGFDIPGAIIDIRRLLDDAGMEIETQLQDGGDFLLIQVKLKERPAPEKMQKWREVLQSHFSAVFPKPKKDYSWMIVLMYGAEIFESVMDEITVSD